MEVDQPGDAAYALGQLESYEYPGDFSDQGAGRLIRDETDRGVLMVCDPRLTGKPYGRRIWQSLPPMRRTREIADVEAFFAG